MCRPVDDNSHSEESVASVGEVGKEGDEVAELNTLHLYQTGEDVSNAKDVGDAKKSVTGHHPVK